MSIYLEPQWSRSALLTIDVQNDFTLPGAIAEVEGTVEVIPRIAELLRAYRAKELPIIHIVRLYKPDGTNADLCRREWIESGAGVVLPGSDGAELVAGIRPDLAPDLDAELLLRGELQRIGSREWVLYKPRWGAFYETQLESFLRSRNVDTVVFSGCNFPNCPRSGIYQASERDLKVVFAGDATSRVYEQGLDELRSIGVHVATAREIAAQVGYLESVAEE